MSRKIEVQIVGDSSSLHKALGSVQTRTRRFGSVLGTSFRAASIGATVGLVGLGIAAKDLFDDFSDGQKATAQTRAVIKSTGGVAGVTTKHVQNLATTIQGYSGIQDDAVQSGENMLLTFKNIRNEAGKGNDIFDQSTKTLADMSTALGEDMPKAAIQLGKALNDPVKGITALSRVGVTFTDGQKKSIDAMVQSGNVMGAQKTILKELQSEFGGSAKAAGQTFSGQMNILRGAFENAGSAILTKLMPYVTRFAQFVMPLAVKAISLVAKGITRLIGYFANLGSHVGVSGGKVRSAFAAVGDFFQSRVMPIVRKLRDIFSQSFENIGKVVSQHGAQIHRIVQRVGAVLQAVAKVAIPILKFALVTVLPRAIGIAIDALDKASSGIAKIIGAARHVAGAIAPVLHRIVNAIVTMKNAASGPLSAVVGFFQSIINKVQDVIGWISRIHFPSPPSWLTGSLLSHLAGGTSFAPGGMAVVGERGPELVHLPRGSRVTPADQTRRILGGGGGGRVIQVNLTLDRRVLGSVMVDVDKDFRRQNAGRPLLSGA